MIVRLWHGRVPTAKADACRAFTSGRASPDCLLEYEPRVVHCEVAGRS